MFVGVESAADAGSATMVAKNKTEPPNPLDGQGARLVRLRAMLGYDTAAAFSRFMKIGQQRWSNFENGAPLSRDIAFQLVRTVPGLTLDWLYFGKPDGLPLGLAERLGELTPPGKRKTE